MTYLHVRSTVAIPGHVTNLERVLHIGAATLRGPQLDLVAVDVLLAVEPVRRQFVEIHGSSGAFVPLSVDAKPVRYAA